MIRGLSGGSVSSYGSPWLLPAAPVCFSKEHCKTLGHPAGDDRDHYLKASFISPEVWKAGQPMMTGRGGADFPDLHIVTGKNYSISRPGHSTAAL